MHLLTLMTVVSIVILLRYLPLSQAQMSSEQSWGKRWRRTLFLFLFPPLLLISTSIAILYMGCHGKMLGIQVGSIGCLGAILFLLLAIGSLGKLMFQGIVSIQKIKGHDRQACLDAQAIVLDTELPYSACVGFWQAELVVSQGLLATLDEEHLAAVLAHEQAHQQYRYTFWFFWLGWLRSFSFWLPKTELLWQELLLLRELRADHTAAQSVDFLVLAESLLKVAQAPVLRSPVWSATLTHPGDRLGQRIDALLESSDTNVGSVWLCWGWLPLLLLPLLILPFHS